jgi:HK97 family phage prohead protease
VAFLNFDFHVKRSGKDLVIQGFSNAATRDRMKEKILPEAWLLENYKKNPIVLFDHGHDPTFGFMPVGKADVIEAQKDGLYTEVKISNSKSEKIVAVRDLVDEGILKTFSVGFDPLEHEKSTEGEDFIDVTKAELIEQSIVPIPMNQDSTFSRMKKKRLDSFRSPLAQRWTDRFIERVRLCQKGAWVAAALHQRLSDLMEIGEVRNRDAALRFVAEEAGVTLGDVKSVLSGEITPVPLKVLQAFATVFRIDKDLLANLDKGDQALLDRVMAREEQDAETQERGGEAMKTKSESTKAAGEAVICKIIVPKDQAESAEAAAEMVSAAGYAADKMEEVEEGYAFIQADPETVDLENAMNVDLGKGVLAVVAPRAAAGDGGGDEERAYEEGKEGEEGDEEGKEKGAAGEGEEGKEDEEGKEKSKDNGGDDAEFSEEEIKDAVEKYNAERAAVAENGEGNPPNWVADEGKWSKAKAMADKAEAEDRYAFAVWAYLNVLEGGKKAGEPGSSKAVGTPDDNPYLELSRQQNVLLSEVINELRGMSSKLDGVVDLTAAKAVGENADRGDDDDSSDDGKDEEQAKSLDLLADYTRDLDVKLKRLNV